MKPSIRRVVVGVLAGVFTTLVAAAPISAQSKEKPAGQDEPAVERTRDNAAEAAAARREALLRVSARGTRVRVGGDVFVGEDERLGKVVAIFGKADVRGIINGDLVTVGGDVHLGPNAIVRGDIVAIAGAVHADNGAWIGGKISEMDLSTSDFKIWLPDEGEVTVNFQPDWPKISRVVFISGMMRNLFWFVVCAVLLFIVPGAVTRVRQQAGESPITAFAVGFVAEILFLPAMLLLAVVLSISIIGVPLIALLPVVAMIFLFAMAVGFTAVVSSFGQQIVGRATPMFALVLGLALVWSLGMSGRYMWVVSHGRFGWWLILLAAGFVVEFIVCTLGLGAALMAWSARRNSRAPAAAPAVPPVPNTPDPLPQGL